MSLSSSFVLVATRRFACAGGAASASAARRGVNIATTTGASSSIIVQRQQQNNFSSSLKDIDYRDDVLSAIQKDESIRNTMSYSLSMSSDISSFATNANASAASEMLLFSFPPLLNDQMREQLRICRNQLLKQNITSNSHDEVQLLENNAITRRRGSSTKNSRKNNATAAQKQGRIDLSIKLPRTLEDAISSSHNNNKYPNNNKAIVVTETFKPFRVVNVNKAWEDLCEYTYVESYGKSLGDLIQGPNTNIQTITALMSQLLKGETATAMITNYKKSGTQFTNRLSVGPIYDNNDKLTHFVGILQEVS